MPDQNSQPQDEAPAEITCSGGITLPMPAAVQQQEDEPSG